MTPPPEYTHDNIVMRINRSLSAHLLQIGDRGSLYVPRASIWTDANTYLEPDLFYVSVDLNAKMDPKRRTTADLVVEVVSPGSAIYDRNTKAETYGALGVRELWLVCEKTETVEVRLQTGSGFDDGTVFEKGQQIASVVFPQLQLSVDSLFQD